MTAPGTTETDALAAPREDFEESPLEPCYLLEAGGLRFAIPLDALRRVHRIDEITPVPGAPAHLAGVALLMNEVVACLDLGCLAGRAALPPGPRVAALVDGPGLQAALLSREVGTMTLLDPARLVPLPPDLAGRLGAGARGQAELEGETAVALDPARLLPFLAPRWAASEAQAHGG